MVLYIDKDLLFKKQWQNRENDTHFENLKELFKEFADSRLPSLKQMFHNNSYAQNYGVNFRFREHTDDGSDLVHTLNIPPHDLERYKVVVLSAFDDFNDNYFDKLKTNVDFNKKFLKDAPNELYLRYVFLIDTVDFRRNLIFGLIEQHEFLHIDGLTDYSTEDHHIDADFLSSFSGYGLTVFDVPIKPVKFDFVRWLYQTEPLFQSWRIHDFGLISVAVKAKDTHAKLYLADKVQKQMLQTLRADDDKSLPFLVNSTGRLAPLFMPLVQEGINKMKLIYDDNSVRFEMKIGKQTYYQAVKVTSDFASLLLLNKRRLVNLVLSALRVKQGYEDRDGVLFKQSDSQYGFMIENRTDLTKDLSDITSDFIYRDYVERGILYCLTRYNQNIIKSLHDLAERQIYDDHLSFKSEHFVKNNATNDLNPNRSGLEQLFDLLDGDDKNLLVANGRVYDFEGTNSIKSIVEGEI